MTAPSALKMAPSIVKTGLHEINHHSYFLVVAYGRCCGGCRVGGDFLSASVGYSCSTESHIDVRGDKYFIIYFGVQHLMGIFAEARHRLGH